ncbi:glucose-6-phosphatase 3 isoform X2 [Toxorhynchites rutilus septentrionalis]|uniref:glucose-6-phosphatase 3 isoform X2 n=1 Tax=Toxorhynchites rutilus septentrionalis TaxID=329112 RepID=UPI002479E7FD|nr:glucose-6-phosphatase 3 isoform X2 [Toxorhynchites rutilus septentrionalis]
MCNFSRYEEYLATVTRAFDPKILFLTVIPLVAACSTRLYSRLLLSVLLTEYVNTLLKWILAEDRPFWWVRETKEFTTLNRPKLYQNELTCEPSPGNPSGHLMTSTTYLYVIFSVLEEAGMRYGKFVVIAMRICYYLALLFISVSRMYFGCHFLHQCIFGILMGVILTKLTMSLSFEKYLTKLTRKRRLTYCSMICMTFLGVYWVQKALGVDPQWSVKMAFKWCDDPFFLDPSTTLVFSIIRLTGALIAFAIVGPVLKSLPLDRKRSIPLTLLMMVVKWTAISYTPRHYGVIVYYLYTFLIHLIFTYCYMRLVPAVTSVSVDSRVQRNNRPKMS